MNLLLKGAPDRPYIITDFIATRLSETDFKRIQAQNMAILGDYRYTPYDETDFSWWGRVNKKLTKKKLYKNVEFHCDFYGNVTEV